MRVSQSRMLLPTKIVVLVLFCAEVHGVIQYKGGPGTFKRGIGQRSLAPDQGAADGYQTAEGTGYGAVGAEGTAQVSIKLDLSVIMQKLGMIPDVQRVLNVLVQKVDSLLNIVQGPQQRSSIDARLDALEQTLLARLDAEDAKLNALYQLIKQFQGPLGKINQVITEIRTDVQELLKTGSTCSNNAEQRLEDMLQQMMSVLRQILDLVSRINPEGPGKSSQQVLTILQQNSQLLQQCLTMIEQVAGRKQVCPTDTSGTSRILQQIAALFAIVEKLPRQIVILLESRPGINSPQLQQILQICESISIQVIGIRNATTDATKEFRKYFAENQRSLVAVKKVVTETTEIVQSSAAAAISASRSLKCSAPSKNSKPDLDD